MPSPGRSGSGIAPKCGGDVRSQTGEGGRSSLPRRSNRYRPRCKPWNDRSGLAALAVILTVFCGVFWAADVSVATVKATAPHAYRDGRPETTKENDHEKPKEPFWQRATDDPVAAFTLVLTVLTAIMAGSSVFLWRSTERLVTGAEDSAQRQLRAYVNIAGVAARNVTDITKTIQYHIVIENTGRTPAYQVRMVYTAELLEYPLSLYPAAEVSGYLSETIIGGGRDAETVFDAERPLRQNEVSALASGTKAIYVFGRIDYQDIFERGHWTRFRFMIGGPVLPRSDGPLAACDEGNECSKA